MPNGYGPYYSNRGYQLGLTEKEYQALWQAIQRGQYSITDYGETGAYLFGFSDTPPSGYTKLIPGTTRPLPTTEPGRYSTTPSTLSPDFIKDIQRAEELGVDTSFIESALRQPMINRPTNDYLRGILNYRIGQAYQGQWQRTGLEAMQQQKMFAKLFPEQYEALQRKAYAGEGFPAGPNQQQRVALWISQQPEYKKLTQTWGQPAVSPTGGYGAGLGASYQAAYLSSLPEHLSPAQREYYQTRATPMYQSFLAERYPTGTQIPPTEQLMPAFKSYLGEYPWLEKYTAMPQRAKGEYPSRFRPPTRWLNW